MQERESIHVLVDCCLCVLDLLRGLEVHLLLDRQGLYTVFCFAYQPAIYCLPIIMLFSGISLVHVFFSKSALTRFESILYALAQISTPLAFGSAIKNPKHAYASGVN